MKIRDLAAAVREYPRLRQALEESRTELETSKLECRRLLDQLNELEPLADEWYQQSVGREYTVSIERQKIAKLQKVLASFCPVLDSTEKLCRFYDIIAPEFDGDGFHLYDAALAISGIRHIGSEFPYEDNRGAFDFADGRQLLKYLTALRFHAVQWDVVPGTPYEKAILLEVDTATPEYRAFERDIYAGALRNMGFQDLLPQERERQTGKQKEKRKEGAER
ncbi:MAG TPA: hypothetical protein H9813_01435 [Candidatus Fournierella merdipullorum]|uniref:Uncharacterized protein n=1 Tax=Candidatus Allofournierella merdipullorum TaxID=2838595 RepID=A0A9D2IY24_9FIRM|nr:hypothetical protein [Candidatus Fournierella merdipullorum]